MSDDSGVASENLTAVETMPPSKQAREEAPAGARAKKQPPYAVVLFNDEDDTFQYVVETLMKVIGYPLEKSFTLTLQVHNEGKGIVWSGTR
jgi:ATP-dependent Clp protease adaptor protein ClpS